MCVCVGGGGGGGCRGGGCFKKRISNNQHVSKHNLR